MRCVANLFAVLSVAIVLSIGSAPSRADTIESYTNSTGMMNGSIPGQSVLTPSGGTGWNNITFNWYDPLSTPYADGTLYILTQEYDSNPLPNTLNSPANLSTQTPGFLAKSTSIATVGGGTEYVFSSTVTLLPNTRYWFYTQDTTAGEYAVGVAGPDNDQRYRANGSTSGYLGPNNSMMIYSLQGSPVPEPSRVVGLTGIALTGLLGLCAIMVRRRASLKITN